MSPAPNAAARRLPLSVRSSLTFSQSVVQGDNLYHRGDRQRGCRTAALWTKCRDPKPGIGQDDLCPILVFQKAQVRADGIGQALLVFDEACETGPPAQGFQSDVPAACKEVEEAFPFEGLEDIEERLLDPVGGGPDAAPFRQPENPPPGLASDNPHRYFWIRISAIWTALSAAPFRMLSATTQRLIPFGMDSSSGSAPPGCRLPRPHRSPADRS